MILLVITSMQPEAENMMSIIDIFFFCALLVDLSILFASLFSLEKQSILVGESTLINMGELVSTWKHLWALVLTKEVQPMKEN